MLEPTSKEEVGRRLRLMREKLRLGEQKDFALWIGYEPKRYNNWETGVAMLPIDAAASICRLVPVDFDYLYRGEFSALAMNVSTLLRGDPPSFIPVPREGRHGS